MAVQAWATSDLCRLAAKMEGKLWVESSPGKGSTFHLLVCVGAVEKDVVRENTSPTAGVPKRILLVEDNVVNQRVALRLLQKVGHDVVVAGNGREALSAWRKEPFDAILMDIQIPEMDGFEATSEIRNERGSAATFHLSFWQLGQRSRATGSDAWKPAWTITSPSQLTRSNSSKSYRSKPKRNSIPNI